MRDGDVRRPRPEAPLFRAMSGSPLLSYHSQQPVASCRRGGGERPIAEVSKVKKASRLEKRGCVVRKEATLPAISDDARHPDVNRLRTLTRSTRKGEIDRRVTREWKHLPHQYPLGARLLVVQSQQPSVWRIRAETAPRRIALDRPGQARVPLHPTRRRNPGTFAPNRTRRVSCRAWWLKSPRRLHR
jgi:hypothetical protein